MAPGMDTLPRALVARITASSTLGEIIYSAPAWAACSTCSAVITVPAPRQIVSPSSDLMARREARVSSGAV